MRNNHGAVRGPAYKQNNIPEQINKTYKYVYVLNINS